MLHLLGFADVLVALFRILHLLVLLACQAFSDVLLALFRMLLARLGFADLLPDLLVEDLRSVGVTEGG